MDINKNMLKAAKTGDFHAVEDALNKGADINAQDAHGVTALMDASAGGFADVVKLLLDNGADKDITESQLQANALIAASVSGKADIIEILLESGSEVDSAGNNGLTPLMYSSAGGYPDAVRILLDHGADADRLNEYEETALMKASCEGHADIVRMLLEEGADTDIQTKEHAQTALMLAADNGQLEVVKLLFEAGADKKITGYALKTAFDYARQNGYDDIMNLLGEAVRDLPAGKIKRKTKKTSPEASKQLVDAIWSNDMNRVIAAIENGAEINPVKNDDIPLSLAVYNGYTDIARLLISEGADVNAKDSVDLTALAKACGGRYVDIVKLLLDNGAEVTRDVEIAASVHNRKDIFDLLKKKKQMQGTPDLGKSGKKGSDAPVDQVDIMEALRNDSPPMKQDEFNSIVEKHKSFIESGGGGGAWETFITEGGIIFGIYKGNKVSDEVQAKLSHNNLEGQDLTGVSLQYADIVGVKCIDQNLDNADLSGSLITDSDFSGASFKNANLSGTDFSRSIMKGCSFQGADLSNADMEKVDFTGSDLRGANTENASLKNCIMKDVITDI